MIRDCLLFFLRLLAPGDPELVPGVILVRRNITVDRPHEGRLAGDDRDRSAERPAGELG